jgi:hypothetical protein
MGSSEMKFARGSILIAALTTLALVIAFSVTLSAQAKSEQVKCLSVKHEITTTGLPLVPALVVNNVQDFRGGRLSSSMRSLKITIGDSVVSDVSVITITDLNNKKQRYVNPKMKTYAEKGFDASEFAVIDSVADSKGPQIEIKKTGKTKEIEGKKCHEIYFRLDKSSSTGVGDAKVKHYFEGSMWVTQDIPNYELYVDYNQYAHNYFRGSRYAAGGFFDILARLDVDQYNLVKLIASLDGIPVEAAFVAQLPSATGGDVFETKIKLINYSNENLDLDHFGFPKDKEYQQVAPNEFKSF